MEKAGIGGERIAAIGLTGQMHGLVLLEKAVKITGSTRPDLAQVEAYRKSYALYRELYPALKPGLWEDVMNRQVVDMQF